LQHRPPNRDAEVRRQKDAVNEFCVAEIDRDGDRDRGNRQTETDTEEQRQSQSGKSDPGQLQGKPL